MSMRPKEHEEIAFITWGDKFGVTVLSEEPFEVRFDHDHKEKLYKQYMNEEDFDVYSVLSKFVAPYQTSENDYVLHGDIFVCYDSKVHPEIVKYFEKLDPSLYKKIRLHVLTDDFLTRESSYTEEVKQPIKEFLQNQQIRLAGVVDSIIENVLKVSYQKEYMLTNEWENENGITVASEEPFVCYWIDYEKKEAFYHEQLNEQEKAVYNVAKAFYRFFFPLQEKERSTDYVLDSETPHQIIQYKKDTHFVWMSSMVALEPERYKRYRLAVITGENFENRQEDSDYEVSERKEIEDFLKQNIPILRKKIDKLVQTHFKPSYEEWKKNR